MTDLPPVKTLAIARTRRPLPTALIWSILVVTGVLLFLFLASAREAKAQRDEQLPSLTSTAVTTPSPLPQPASSTTVPAATSAGPITPPFTPASTPAAALYPNNAEDRARARARAPVLIVDLAQASAPRGSPADRPTQASEDPAATPDADKGKSLSNSERFSARVGKEEVEVAEAVQLRRLNRIVTQGTTIAAVMETALNSDLPGYARAIVQSDVRSFDGSSILIPAGSRVIGKYESGVAQGASRIFIVWTRLIRPDGVSIALASPAVDDLGRGGVAGKVNRHFLQRFGGSILLTVLTGGLNAATASATNGNSVVVSSSGQASGLAEQASRDLDIPPTIKTPQGASIRIFVARDLDFSQVGPVK